MLSREQALRLGLSDESLRRLLREDWRAVGRGLYLLGGAKPTFVQQAIADAPITVFASGQQVRAFLAATDLARFLTDHMDAALAAGHTVINVGNPGNAVTVMQLAERVRELMGSSSPIERRPSATRCCCDAA